MAIVVPVVNPTVQGGIVAGTTGDATDWGSLHTVAAMAVLTTFAATTVTAQLRGSMDGTNFYNLGVGITVVGNTLVTTIPFRFLAVSVTAVALTVTLAGVTVAVGAA